MKPFFENSYDKTTHVFSAVSGIVTLLGICGLLIGYFTQLSPIGHAIAGGEPILKGSLMGVVIEIIRGSITMPAFRVSEGFSGALPIVLYLLVLILISAVLLSTLLTITALIVPRCSRALALSQGIFLFFVYFLLFAANALLFLLSDGKLTQTPFDLPSFLTAIVLFAVLLPSAILSKKAIR